MDLLDKISARWVSLLLFFFVFIVFLSSFSYVFANVLYSQLDDSVQLSGSSFAGNGNYFTDAVGHPVEVRISFNDNGNGPGTFILVAIVDADAGVTYYGYNPAVSTQCGSTFETTGSNTKQTLVFDTAWTWQTCSGVVLNFDPSHHYSLMSSKNTFSFIPVYYYGSSSDPSDYYGYVEDSGNFHDHQKSITSFGFSGLANGVIDEANQVISIYVPFGTDISALAPEFISVSDGATVNPGVGVAQDFNNPVTYTVTAIDGSTRKYKVKALISCNTNCVKSVLYSQPDDSVEIASGVSAFPTFTGASGNISNIKFSYNDHGETTGHFMGLAVVDLNTGTNYYASMDGICGDAYESTGVNGKVVVSLDSSMQYKVHPCTGPNLVLDPTHTYGVSIFRNRGGTGKQRIYGSSDMNDSVSLYVEGYSADTLVHNPILFIPGVLGNDILKDGEKLWLDLARNFTDIGDQFMDPLQFNEDLTPSSDGLIVGNLIMNPVVGKHFYDLIIQEFENQGYTQGSNSNNSIFLFPYDWRYGVNNLNVYKLKQKIEDIKTQTGSDKLDIVAHSTGGLLVKKYVIDNFINHSINKAVFVGVPNTGAPQAIKTLLQGSNFGIPWLADSEMKKISKNLPIVYDLSPSQQYFDVKGSYVKIINQESSSPIITSQDLDFSQINSFLINDHDLNNQALVNAHNLHTTNYDNLDIRNAGIDLYSINGCKAATLSKVIERRYKDIFGNIHISYDQPERSPGDGTVPLESSTNLPINQSNKFYALKADHAKMPSQNGIRQQIVNIIAGSSLETKDITQDISQCKLNGKAVSIYSPLDIEITDQDGNYSGLNFGAIENDIPNASFEIMGEHKFVYLPTDEGQVYNISLKGTGSGVFTLVTTDVVDNQYTQTETFSDIPVTTNLKGSLNINTYNTKLSLDINGDNNIDLELKGKPGEIVTMPYLFSGFLQPINDTKYHPEQKPSVFKAGSTVPVKFQLKKYDGVVTQAESLPIWITPQKGSLMNMPVGESTYNITSTSGNEFRWDSVDQQYIYNWSTKGLVPGYWYKLSVRLDDGNMYSVTVGLR